MKARASAATTRPGAGDAGRLPPGVTWLPWALIAIGVVLVGGGVVLRLEGSLLTSQTVETTDTRPLAPAPRTADAGQGSTPATRVTKRSETKGPPSDTLIGLALGLGLTLIVAGSFYHRISEVPLPGGLGSVKLRSEPEPQAFPPSGPPVVVPAQDQYGEPQSALTTIRDQPALAQLHLSAAQERLQPVEETRVAVVTVGLDPGVARHPAFGGRVEEPLNIGLAGPGDLMAAQVGLIAALAPSARILPVGVFDATGTGSLSTALHGVYAAVAWKPDIVFLDFGFPIDVPPAEMDDLAALQVLLERLDAFGTLIIAPAGNDGAEVAAVPASIPGVLGVTALKADLRLAAFSSRGVEIAAPGVDILTVETVRGDDLALSHRSGTSLAAGVATGIAALVRAARPAMPGRELRERLISTGSPVAQHSAIRAVDLDALVENRRP